MPRLPNRGELLLIILVLGTLLAVAGKHIQDLNVALRSKPKVEIVYKDRVVEKRVQGPVRIEEKVIETPGKDRVIERVITRDAVVTDRSTDREGSHTETPVCPAPKTWAIGGGIDLRRRDRGAVGISKSFGDLSLGVGHAVGEGATLLDFQGNVSLKVF